MIRLHRRHRLLLGALALAATIWLLDRLSGGTGPPPAQAGGTPHAPPPAPPDWSAVDALIGRVIALRGADEAPRLPDPVRDVFQPSALLADLLAAAQAPPPAATEPPPEDPAADFAARHRLSATVLGTQPLAVVDDVVVGLGAVLDGHKLVAVERDAVVFEALVTRVRVRLTMPVPGSP